MIILHPRYMVWAAIVIHHTCVHKLCICTLLDSFRTKPVPIPLKKKKRRPRLARQQAANRLMEAEPQDPNSQVGAACEENKENQENKCKC